MERLIEKGVGPEFLLSEANGNRSRAAIVIGASQTLLAGAVLGQILYGALAAAAAPGAGNAGAATITAAPAVAAGTPLGVYVLTAVSAGATAAFQMTSPEGVPLGTATTGTPATIAGIGPFTITDAGADPAIGDRFTITVTAAQADEQDAYVAHNPAATNGSQIAAAILYDAVTTGADEVADATGIVREAEVIADRLAWGTQNDGQKAAALAQLAERQIIAR